jgi:hypothetical protein
MTEKVLGFYKKDSIDYGGHSLEIYKKELVPVVSVSWLKKWCKKEEYFAKKVEFDSFGNNRTVGKTYLVIEKDALLCAVEKEAGERKDVWL